MDPFSPHAPSPDLGLINDAIFNAPTHNGTFRNFRSDSFAAMLEKEVAKDIQDLRSLTAGLPPQFCSNRSAPVKSEFG